jgi:pilus assembly protein Flp/PilA
MQELLMAPFVRVYALLKQEEGQAAVEYGVLVALIIAVAIGVISTLGTDVSGAFQSVVTKL